MSQVASLVSGFIDFKKAFFSGANSLYSTLKTGQAPKALVIACCDSRVDPALLLQCRPGDIFVLRSIANLVPPSNAVTLRDATVSALAYGVLDLGLTDIIILGHSDCGGIRTLVSQGRDELPQHLSAWLDIAKPALDEAKRVSPGASDVSVAKACEKISVLFSVNNLLSYPWIQDRVDAGVLALHPWFFDMQRGELLKYNSGRRIFENYDSNACVRPTELSNESINTSIPIGAY